MRPARGYFADRERLLPANRPREEGNERTRLEPRTGGNDNQIERWPYKDALPPTASGLECHLESRLTACP